jgi:hypothetical protein
VSRHRAPKASLADIVMELARHEPSFAGRYTDYLRSVLAAMEKDGPSAKLPPAPAVRS